MPTKRLTGAAAVRRSGVSAGTIDSSSGRAKRHAGAAQERPTRNVFLRNEHESGLSRLMLAGAVELLSRLSPSSGTARS